jgi:hypothetical protein
MDTVRNLLVPWTKVFESKKEEQKGGADAGGGDGFMGLLFAILLVVLGIFSAYLCWNCNTKAHEDLGLKVIYTIIAFFNAIPYLLYYLIIRIVLHAECAPVK